MAEELGFAEFYAEQYERLYRLAYWLTGDQGQAEELAQDALVRTWWRWPLVRRLDRPGHYARRVLVNRHRSLLRRALVEARYAARQQPDEVQPFDGHEDAAVLAAALRRLSPRQRAVVVLRYGEDLPVVEVARLLGTSVGAVKSASNRALPGCGTSSARPTCSRAAPDAAAAGRRTGEHRGPVQGRLRAHPGPGTGRRLRPVPAPPGPLGPDRGGRGRGAGAGAGGARPAPDRRPGPRRRPPAAAGAAAAAARGPVLGRALGRRRAPSQRGRVQPGRPDARRRRQPPHLAVGPRPADPDRTRQPRDHQRRRSHRVRPRRPDPRRVRRHRDRAVGPRQPDAAGAPAAGNVQYLQPAGVQFRRPCPGRRRQQPRRQAHLWDVARRARLAVLQGVGRTNDLAFSADGRQLVAAGASISGPAATVIVDVAQRRRHPTMWVHSSPGSAPAVAFRADGTALAASNGLSSGGVARWDVTRRHDLVPVATRYQPSGVVLSRGAGLLAVSRPDGEVSVWDFGRRVLLGPLPGFHPRQEFSLSPRTAAFSDDGRQLAVSDGTGSVFVWNLWRRRRATLGQPPEPTARPRPGPHRGRGGVGCRDERS